MWLISPLAQELVFTGYLYGRLEPLFPGYVHPRFRVRWALVVIGLCFAAWHLHNVGKLPAAFVAFQLTSTFVEHRDPAQGKVAAPSSLSS
jgi:membrane protease YdiL (CAAX protease family)